VRRDCFKSQRSALFSFFKINTFKTKKYKNPITEKVNPINVISSFNSDRRFQSNHFEHESRELVDYEALALFAGSEGVQPVEKPVEKPIKKVYDLNARGATLQDIFALNPSADITLKLFSNYSSFFYKRYVAIIRKTIKHILQKKDLREDNQRLMHFSKMAFNLVSYIKTNRLESKKNNLFAIKRVQFQKLVFSLRFRKSKLPVGLRYRQKTDEKTGQRSFISKLIRKNNDYFMRSKLIRFYRKKRKKRIHNKKIIRLKGVHFFIPSYLQIDFRTLRAVKVQSPGQENIVYPFRISLSKRYAFYRSKRY
jgi:hypothetical protein